MVILITGISSGFGRAMAAALAADGHKVYGTCRREVERLPGVSYLKADVQSEADAQAAVSVVLSEEGRIDVFINNAGMGIGGPLELTSVEDAQRQMDVNFMGMVRFLHYVIPVMREQHSGLIICFSSIGGLMGLPFQGMYSASKFAIEGYCESLRLELREFNVRVTVINPGDFSTGFTANRTKQQQSPLYPAYASALKAIETDENGGLKPEYLARKIVRIVRKRRPRNHYIIATFIQKASVWLKAILPQRMYDLILSSYYKM